MKFVYITNSTKLAIIDDEDWEKVHKYNWSIVSYDNGGRGGKLEGKGRIITNVLDKTIPLTYIIMGEPPIKNVWDHADRDPYNNQKSNLRLATRSQNQANRLTTAGVSGYRGVSKNKKRWKAQIVVDKRMIHIGTYDTPEQAAEAYNEFALLHFGEFAVLNNVDKK